MVMDTSLGPLLLRLRSVLRDRPLRLFGRHYPGINYIPRVGNMGMIPRSVTFNSTLNARTNRSYVLNRPRDQFTLQRLVSGLVRDRNDVCRLIVLHNCNANRFVVMLLMDQDARPNPDQVNRSTAFTRLLRCSKVRATHRMLHIRLTGQFSNYVVFLTALQRLRRMGLFNVVEHGRGLHLPNLRFLRLRPREVFPRNFKDLVFLIWWKSGILQAFQAMVGSAVFMARGTVSTICGLLQVTLNRFHYD